MNTPDEPEPSRVSFLSAEAIIGIGITIAAIGVMCLLLGFAQSLRDVEEATWVLVPLGAVLLVVGVVATFLARSGAGRK